MTEAGSDLSARARTAVLASAAAVHREAARLLQESGVATDALLARILERGEAVCQLYDINGDPRGRFPGAEFHRASLAVALVAQLGARPGSDGTALVAALAKETAALARKSSLLHNAAENLRSELCTASQEGDTWHIWPREERHLGLGNYERAMTASTRPRFHELLEEFPVPPHLVRRAEYEVEDKFRFRVGGDVTGPRRAPALDSVVRHEADLCRRAIEEELRFLADNEASLGPGLRLADSCTVLWGLFAVLHRRRLVLKNWAMRYPQEAGEGLVVVRDRAWFAREIALVTELAVERADEVLVLLSAPASTERVSDHFLMRRPLITLSDGRLMTGCHLVQSLRYSILACELLENAGQHPDGDRLPRVMAEELRKLGACAASNLRFKEGDLQGDVDLAWLWDGHLFIAECKATAGFFRPDRTANLRNEIDSSSENCAVEQVGRSLRYVDLAPSRVAKELNVQKDVLMAAKRVPVILLSGMEFDGCAARGIPIRCASRLLQRVSSATELERALLPRPPVIAEDAPEVVEVDGKHFVIHAVDRSVAPKA